MKTMLLSTVLAAIFAAQGAIAQATGEKQEAAKAEAPKLVTKVFQLKYQDVNQMWNLLFAIGAQLRQVPEMRVLSATGSHEQIAAIEEIIKRLDVPLPPVKNVEVTVYLVAGLQQTSQDSVPKELEPVTKQLKGLFSYQGFRVLDTLIVRARDGEGAEASGVGVPTWGGQDTGEKAIYQVRLGKVRVAPDGQGNVIRIDNLKLGARVPTRPPNVQYIDTGFTTNIDLREGQKVVVGKANIDGVNAMILVVTAKVAD